MKIFGSWKELVSLVFRKDTREVTLRPNQATTYTADRDIQLPPGDAAHVLTSATSTQTLTNKTIDGDDNTVQDLPLTALKTALSDADRVLARDAAGVPVSKLIENVNVSASAAIDYSKLSVPDGSITYAKLTIADSDLTIAKTSGLQSALDSKVDENVAITGATHTKITYDAKGLVTAGTVLAAGDIPSGVPAANIADGSVDNTEFQKLGTAGTSGAGNLVTTDGAQILTAKDIDGGTASNTSRITLPSNTLTNLNALTRKTGTLLYGTDTETIYVDDGAVLVPITAVGTVPAEDDITGLIWTGTAPTVDTAKCMYHQVGNTVTLSILIKTSVAGVGNNQVAFAFPSYLPVPRQFSTSVNNSWIAIGDGSLLTSLTGTVDGGGSGILRDAAGDIFFVIYSKDYAAINTAAVNATITYICD